MPIPRENRLIMVVAQQPFDSAINRFCKLVPFSYLDGSEPDPSDFPNDGEIWWMLNNATALLAEPGRLVVASIEEAPQFDQMEQSSSKFQAVKESVSDIEPREALLLLRLPSDAITHLHDIASERFRLQLPCQPPNSILFVWRRFVVGPFTSTRLRDGAVGGVPSYSFAPARRNQKVFQFDLETFLKEVQDARIERTIRISCTPDNRQRAHTSTTIKHELVFAKGMDRALAGLHEVVDFEPLANRLIRITKDYYSRAKRKELRKLLEDLDLTMQEGPGPQDADEVIRTLKDATEMHTTALDELALAIIRSGALGEDRIARVEQQLADRYVQDNIVRIQAQIDLEIAVKEDRLQDLESELRDAGQVVALELEERRRDLDKELEARKIATLQTCEAQQLDIERQKAELDRQRDLLQTNLQEVTRELREEGDAVVNRFLTIAPLLGQFANVGQERSMATPLHGTVPNGNPTPSHYVLPQFIVAPTIPHDGELSEQTFMDRFRQVVTDAGYKYRDLDLIRFHLSLKCGDITVVGGPSGTGKSSLPQLYGKALIGQEAEVGRPSCLMVNVSPAWMDSRDLIGHTNPIEGTFHPSESGLFHHLLHAQEEHITRGTSTGLYLACLDEMNLAQVEHYFSDFMMVMERTGESRVIRCFVPDSVGQSSPFQKWGNLKISPAVRMVGTVNFDETTRLLSDRFMDRTNLINLACESLPTTMGNRGGLPAAPGRMVTLGDFDRWQRTASIPPELGELLDEMRPCLLQLGSPISPRVYRAICKFIGGSQALLSPQKAFDVQIAQRILPKIRTMVRPSQQDALDKVIRILEASLVGSFDESLSQLLSIRDSIGIGDWSNEE